LRCPRQESNLRTGFRNALGSAFYQVVKGDLEIAAFTGLRFGELAALRVKHLDLLHREGLVAVGR